jgi:hypothetical protein
MLRTRARECWIQKLGLSSVLLANVKKIFFTFSTVIATTVLFGCAVPRSEYTAAGIPMVASQTEREQIEKHLRLQVQIPLDSNLSFQRVSVPHYTNYLRRYDIQGSVALRFVVESDGSISNIEVIGEAHPALVETDEGVLLALVACRFKQALVYDIKSACIIV